MKAYCAQHDLALNFSEKRWKSDSEGKTNCKCCGRYIDKSYNHGLELKIDSLGNLIQDVCNCFITGDGDGYYTKEQLSEYNEDRTAIKSDESQAEYDYENYVKDSNGILLKEIEN